MAKNIEKQNSNAPPEKKDLPPDLVVLNPPGVELFYAGTSKETQLPREVMTNPKLLEEARQRRELYDKLKEVFDKVDLEMEIEEARNKRLIGNRELTSIYTSLSNFIETDENNIRVILYLPFQLLPNLAKPSLGDKPLDEVREKFAGVYSKAWFRLLFESDVRASFVDGDILEPGLGEPPRVRKAAHLIPEILQSRIITPSEIIGILEVCGDEDSELKKSLLEGVVVAHDKNLITSDDWDKIKKLGGLMPEGNPAKRLPNNLTPAELAIYLKEEFATIDKRFSPDSEYFRKISLKRQAWESDVMKNKAIDQVAKVLARKVLEESISIKDLQKFPSPIASIRGVMWAGDRNSEFISKFLPWIQELAKSTDPSIQDAAAGCLSHWNINRSSGLTSKDLADFAPALIKISKDPYLEKHIYPFILLYGSRVKGHSKPNADLDLAIAFKPETQWGERVKILTKLASVSPEIGIIGETGELWLDKKDGKFGFKTLDQDDKTILLPWQIHFIFGGVWLGVKGEWTQVRDDLVGRYLKLDSFGSQKEEAKQLLLRKLEIDALQYRLMHKGYQWLYPNNEPEKTENSSLIDADSSFWDPGYRRMASLLFLSRVFLPEP